MQVQEQFGLEGYGFFWLILEFLGEKMTKNDPPSMSLSAGNWKKITGVSAKKLQLFLAFLSELKLFDIKFEEKPSKMITISCDNLLKFKDEYTGRK